MDAVDREILGTLMRNGRISYRDLGAAVGLSANAAADRVRRLRRDGVITGFTATVDQGAAGRGLVALIDVRLAAAGTNEAFEEACARLEPVTDAVHVTGPLRLPAARGVPRHRRARPDAAPPQARVRRHGDRHARRAPERPRTRHAVRVLVSLGVPLASIGSSFSSFFDAVGDFVSNLAAVNWLALLLGMAIFVGYLSLRARASFHILRAAYPEERIEFRNIWGAYLAGYGFNSVVPARGGDVVRLFLTKTSVPNSSYPAVASSFAVEQIFDLTMASRSCSSRSPRARSRSRRTSRRCRPSTSRSSPRTRASRCSCSRRWRSARWPRSRCCRRACARSGSACARA